MTPRVSEAVRQQVRSRADQCCEYCGKPELASLFSHHVDHIIPILHGGTSNTDNLAWACFQCNVAKGTNVASYDDQGILTPLFNPRSQAWDSHFELNTNTGMIISKTPIGQVTLHVL